MTVYACPFEHPDGYLVWGDPAEVWAALERIGVDAGARMVTRLLPWLAHHVSGDEYGGLMEFTDAVPTDRWAPSLAYYTALGDRERVAVLEKLASGG